MYEKKEKKADIVICINVRVLTSMIVNIGEEIMILR